MILTGLNKRPYLGTCEVCGMESVKSGDLAYHHWDDSDPSMGMWLCHMCHGMAEVYDNQGTPDNQEMLKIYLRLKVKILTQRITHGRQETS